MRKILLSILGIMIMLCVIFLGYEIRYSQKQEVNNMMAIYIEEEKGTGKYQKTNLYKWPNNSEYALNMHKTYCENGSILRYNLETNKINVKVKGTDKCYIYFDKASYGTEEHPYLIQTIEDLVRLSNKVSAGTTYEGEYFLLTNDLDFNNPSDYEDANRTDFKDINGVNGNETLIKELTTGSGFKPIGNSKQTFQGNFDGNNKTINNLYINNKTEGDALRFGLFGEINNSIIKNLTLKGNISSTTRAVMGSVSGGVRGTTTISNITNYVTITSESNEYDVGGIIGGNYGIVTIQNCQNYGEISGAFNTGGIVGFVNNNLTIENSINNASITNNIGNYVGGIVGQSNSATTILKIANSHNEGQITSGYALNNRIAIGGIIGMVNGKASIENCSNNNQIVNTRTSFENFAQYDLGGIIGLNFGQSQIKKCQNKASITGGTYIGGITGLNGDNATLIMDKCFNYGSIDNHQISFSDSTRTSLTETAGLLGYNSRSISYIINSQNYGNINGFDSAAGINMLSFNNIVVLNSSNNGNTASIRNDIYGIGYYSVSNSQKVNDHLNNVYNVGQSKRLAFFEKNVCTNCSLTPHLNNLYYLDGSVTTKTNDDIMFGNYFTMKDKNYMQSQAFVDELNENILNEYTLKTSDGQITLTEIDPLLKDYTLSKWTLGSDSYPTLINE